MNIDQAWRIHAEATQGAGVTGVGRVYTPRDVALRLAQMVLEPLTDAPSLLDPACGSGSLLLAAVEWASQERPGWLEHWLGGGLSGWDIDSAAVEACNRVLATAFDVRATEFSSVRDALAESGEFDCVLANPPWVSLSGRHARDIDPQRRAFLAERYPAFAGWPGLHTAFAEQCSRMTRAETGRLGLLLPMQMADLAGYAATRSAVTSRLTLEHAAELGEGVFPGVNEPTGMFIFAGGTGTDGSWIRCVDDSLPAHVHRFSSLPPESFGDVGVHTGNAASLLVAREGAGRALRIGRDIAPFALAQPSHVLRDVDLPEGKYARVAAESRYRDAVIVLRQTASRPIAARHEPWAYFRNSVLACYGAPGHDVDYLLGVLNSEVVARIHRVKFRDARQRTFPQLKISHLRALPIPGPEIGSVYARIANAARAVQEGFPQAHADLEVLVSQVYGL